tara:strand:- start:7014 stop:7211 length:198 start_codon:yes stop_codon:yes gene_type:complete
MSIEKAEIVNDDEKDAPLFKVIDNDGNVVHEGHTLEEFKKMVLDKGHDPELIAEILNEAIHDEEE